MRTRHVLFVVRQVKGKHRIRVAVGQRQQVGTTNEKVSVKVGDAHAFGATNAHDGFKRGRGRQGFVELGFKARRVVRFVKVDVRVHGTRGALGQFTQRRQIHILVRKQIHVNANLLSTKFHSCILVPGNFRFEQLDFIRRTHNTGLLPRFQSAITEIGQNRLKDGHFTTNLLHDGKGRLERRSEARL